jgi:uncharacterized protein (DUF433 family)
MRDEIARLYHLGSCAPEIAEQMGIGVTTTYRVLRQDRIRPAEDSYQRGRARKVSPEQEAKIVSAYESGERAAALAEQFGLTGHGVRAVIRRRNGSMRRGMLPSKVTELMVDDILAMRGQGMSQAKIGREIGVSQSAISLFFKARGQSIPFRSGANHGAWKGGRVVNPKGYVHVRLAPDSPFWSMRMHNGYIPEHRLVMAQALGRTLTASEQVHHIDGDRKNNEVSNLQLRNGPHGSGIVLACRSCGSHDVGPVPIGSRK